MPNSSAPSQPKQIVYLFGAGATYAEVMYRGARQVNTLMSNIGSLEGVSSRILRQCGRTALAFGLDENVDVEKLISLLTASGVASHSKFADDLRQYYFEDLRTSLIAAKIVAQPKLAMALLEMHNHASFRTHVESLSGILTTNHDGLLQVASAKVLKSLNLGIPFESKEFTFSASEPLPPILQLHGSLTWKFAVPLKVNRLGTDSKYSRDTMWIPPMIQKETKSYPFNKLNALAYEVLSKQCDVLRVVGASLTQNDWNVLSLLFNAQRHRERTRKKGLSIELIMPQRAGLAIQNNSSYLNRTLVIGSLSDGHFAEFQNWSEKNPPVEQDLGNPFFYWLKQKISFHQRQNHFGETGIGPIMREIMEK